MKRLTCAMALTLACGLSARDARASATIQIVNLDGSSEGFNDNTPAEPVGGNPGTTIGQQRMNCFQQAANIWAGLITSPVPIVIQAAFNPLTCTSTSAVLGSSGPRFVEINNPHFEFQSHWYHEALANKEAGVDLSPPSPTDNGSEITAQFNSNLGQSNCLSSSGWYYGFDHNHGTKIDLVDVILHELGHGLGFSTVTDGSTGLFLNGFPALWDHFTYSETTHQHWDQMLPADIAASAIDTGNLSWDGTEVTAFASTYMSPAPELVVPFGIGVVSGNAAPFGAPLTAGGFGGTAVVVQDPVSPNTDGCETPFTNAAAVAGAIAVIDRGLCTFPVKVKNAQTAGAIACVLVNNVSGPFVPTGSDPSITIPVIAISQEDGASLKASIAAGDADVTLRLSPTARAGTTPSGRMRLYSPNPFVPGGSVSHWDPSALPNLLMEPVINSDLTNNVDLTTALFRDIGWLPHAAGVTPQPPHAVALAGRPNPAPGATRVHFELTTDEPLTLELFDMSGRRVRTLARETFAAGNHDVPWNGLDDGGRPAGPGVYLARLKGPRTQASEAIVLVR